MVHDTQTIIQQMLSIHKRVRPSVPNSRAIPPLIEALLELLFPHFSQQDTTDPVVMEELLRTATHRLAEVCTPVVPHEVDRRALQASFLGQLPLLSASLYQDAEAIYTGDPAASSVDEVIIAYPGFLAIAMYRIAHWLLLEGVPIVPRMISEYAHRVTGIDIHPGATIGRSFVIDHGTGVVIGETTIIQDNVKIYQGVTLGALSVEKSAAHTKRHPTIESDVVIYANATILGGATTIGAGSVIGGNVWIVNSVAQNSRVYHRAENTLTSITSDTTNTRSES